MYFSPSPNFPYFVCCLIWSVHVPMLFGAWSFVVGTGMTWAVLLSWGLALKIDARLPHTPSQGFWLSAGWPGSLLACGVHMDA